MIRENPASRGDKNVPEQSYGLSRRESPRATYYKRGGSCAGGSLSADKRRCAPLIILPSIRCALTSDSNVFTGRLLIEGRYGMAAGDRGHAGSRGATPHC